MKKLNSGQGCRPRMVGSVLKTLPQFFLYITKYGARVSEIHFLTSSCNWSIL